MDRRSFLGNAGVGVLAGALTARVAWADEAKAESVSASTTTERLQGVFQPLNIEAGLEPFVPSASNPWDVRAAGHLLRRTLFEPRKADITTALQLTPAQVVDRLFRPIPLPPEPSWIDELPQRPTTPEAAQAYLALLRQRSRDMQNDWITQMATSDFSIREKMVLFWHNHFTTSLQVINLPQYMFRQIKLFRLHVTGDFKKLTKDITTDAAMLLYLDGARNRVGRPNENYARELFELFTLGEGNYTERDIVEAARALTGWTVNNQRLASEFIQLFHDRGVKEVFGKTGNFDAFGIVDLVFEKPETAEFLARKLYQYFVYVVPDERIVSELATIIRNNNYVIEPALKTLLTSAHFFDAQLHGAHIKSPIEFTIGAVRHFELINMPADYVRTLSAVLGMNILYPPDVSGWRNGRTWINTTTLPTRFASAKGLVTGVQYKDRKSVV